MNVSRLLSIRRGIYFLGLESGKLKKRGRRKIPIKRV